MNKLLRLIAGFLVLILFASCQSYKPMVLEPNNIIKELEKSRKLSSSNQAFNFSDAERLMSERNRHLKKLKLEYEKLQKIANIKTPFPNPSLELGPAFGSNLGQTAASSTQPFIGLGFTIPLGPRLARSDDLNKAKELQAYNKIVIEHRKLYFDLRKAYIDYQLSQQTLEVISKLEKTLELSQKTTEKLIQLGSATKLGLSQVKLQIKELNIQKLDYKSKLEDSLAVLSSLLDIPNSEIAKLKAERFNHKDITLSLEKINALALDNNLALAAEEMEFHVADYELKVELAKQYPDLTIGVSSEDEVGEKKRTISIPFSIDLPVFDRNQHSISAAYSNRQIKIETYKSILAEILTTLEKNYKQYNHSKSKVRMISEEILPLAQETVSDAEKSLKFGSIDVLRYLDLVVQNQQYQLDAISQHRDFWERTLSLEKVTGIPLVKFTQNDPNGLKNTFKPMVK
ncbi:MAG: TolC family protein [Lentisphaeraceae bacterium]|nr:TolC family protein [Lentisphaeraceae bacterium]